MYIMTIRGGNMGKVIWNPGTMLYPVPAVMVSCKYRDVENIITVSWAGTVCSNPPMVSISIRPERFSYDLIKNSGEFIINIPNKNLAFAADFCGVKSGRDVDKFEYLKLGREKGAKVEASLINEAPLSIECRVREIKELGSHHMFIADVLSVDVEDSLIDKGGKLHLDKAELICYNHGQYFVPTMPIGKFGFSVEKKKKLKK